MRPCIPLASILRCLAVVLAFLFLTTTVCAQITPIDDAYINTAAPSTNYGGAVSLAVNGTTEAAYMTFDLSSIPSGYSGSNIAKASLKLYVNTLPRAGSFNVDYVNGSWTEATITAGNAPPPGATIAASVPLAKSQVLDYVNIDVTPAVQAWLNGTQPNYGIALVANSTFSATFDSKESKTQSHPPELDIVYEGGGGGGITGVLTGPGSGLQGGGTSGTLNLSLLTSCAGSQILQWTGSAWACSSTGTGTITGVTAGTDLSGGGNSGNVTLNLNVGATDLRYAQLAAANTFTGNQAVNGNLSATQWVSGSGFNIGSNLFAFGSYANRNAFLGFAGNTTTTGTNNTATGYQALLSNIGGYQNTADGYVALKGNTTGHDNTASGSFALYSNTWGYNNTAIGANALNRNTGGVDNTASGIDALVSNTTGSYNTASGSNALNHNTIGSYNTASGYLALLMNTTAGLNTAVGFSTLYSNTIGSSNTGLGASALYSNVGDSAQDGWYNTAVGVEALYFNNDTSGTGYKASGNTAVGFQALNHNSTGPNGVAEGYRALYSNTTGGNNTALGTQALYSNTEGDGGTAIGRDALFSNTTGDWNTATGIDALHYNTTGFSNTAIGMSALNNNTTGTGNTASGVFALVSNIGGGYNTADGIDALFNNTTGSYNTAVGTSALQSNVSGNYLTCIGYNCTSAEALTNATAIGAHAIVGQSDSLVLGGTGEWGVKVGIGTTTPANILTIGRGLGHPVSDSWETYSSRRWKTNIRTLHGALGKVEQLRGVSYDLKANGKHEVGVIAEEVGAVVPEVVTWEKNGTDAQSVDYGRLTALLIESTKEQQALIHKQQEQIRMQQAQIQLLTRQVREVRSALNGSDRTNLDVHTVKAMVSHQ